MNPAHQANPAITIFRIVLWLLPAAILVLGGALAGMLGTAWPVGAILILSATVGLGYLDQRLRIQQLQRDAQLERDKIVNRTILFVLLQIVIAPVIVITVFYGYCIVTNSGF